MNKVQCHNCRSSKREFYVYTQCKHFLCLQCTFCMTDFQKGSIRCCYIYTPLSQELKEIIQKQIQARLQSSQVYVQQEYQQKVKQIPITTKIPPHYFKADSIKQENNEKQIPTKKTKIESIYMKDPYQINQYRNSYKNSQQNFIRIETGSQRKNIQKDVMLFQQQLNIQAQINNIHQSYKNYHKELELSEKEAIKKLCVLNQLSDYNTSHSQNYLMKQQNNWSQSEKEKCFNNYLYPQQRVYCCQSKTNWKKYSNFQDRITSKLDHFKNVLKEKLVKHYI